MSDRKEFMFNDLIGVPFKYGGMDCWNLAREVFKRYGKKIPDYDIARCAVESYDLNEVSEAMIDISKNEWLELDKPKTPCVIAMSLGIPGFINMLEFTLETVSLFIHQGYEAV